MKKNVDYYRPACPFEVLLRFTDRSVYVCLKSVPRVGDVVSVTAGNVNQSRKDSISSAMINRKWRVTAQLPANGCDSVFNVSESL